MKKAHFFTLGLIGVFSGEGGGVKQLYYLNVACTAYARSTFMSGSNPVSTVWYEKKTFIFYFYIYTNK